MTEGARGKPIYIHKARPLHLLMPPNVKANHFSLKTFGDWFDFL